MNRELIWLQGPPARSAAQSDRLYSSVAADPEQARSAFKQAIAREQVEEDRRLSAAGAFFMFIFGFGCGVFWTIVLSLFF